MRNTTCDAVAAQYGLGEIRECVPLHGTRNRNFVLHTDSGAWFLRRRYAGYCAPDWIAFDTDAMTFLHERGVPVAPPHPALDGTFSWNDGRDVWQVFPFMSGRAFREGDAEDLAALAASTALFHKEGAAFPARYEKLSPRGETCPRDLGAIADQLASECAACAAPLQCYREWLDQASRALPDERYAALPHTLIHGDIQPANLLFPKSDLPLLLDMDWCAWRPRVYDLAFAVLFCCAERATPVQGDDIWSLTQPLQLRPEPMRLFFDAYTRRHSALSEEEARVFPAQMALSWCSSRLTGALKVSPEQCAAFLERPPHTLAGLGI